MVAGSTYEAPEAAVVHERPRSGEDPKAAPELHFTLPLFSSVTVNDCVPVSSKGAVWHYDMDWHCSCVQSDCTPA